MTKSDVSQRETWHIILLSFAVITLLNSTAFADRTFTFKGETWIAKEIFNETNCKTKFGGKGEGGVQVLGSGLIIPYCDDWHSPVMAVRERKFAGDFTFTARIDSFNSGSNYTWLCMTARENLNQSGRTGGSPHVDVIFNPNGKSGIPSQGLNRFDAKNPVIGSVLLTNANPPVVEAREYDGPATSPLWMRLVRSGNNFSAYYCSGNELTNWKLVGTRNYKLSNEIYIGFYLTSAEAYGLKFSTWSNIEIKSGPVRNEISTTYKTHQGMQIPNSPVITMGLRSSALYNKSISSELYNLQGKRIGALTDNAGKEVPAGIYFRKNDQ